MKPLTPFNGSCLSMPWLRHMSWAWTGAVCMTLAACGGGDAVSSLNQSPNQVQLIEAKALASGLLMASWLPAADDTTSTSALRYQLHASTNPDFTPNADTLKFEGTGVTMATINAGLNAGTRYAVRLIALDDSDASTTSAAFSVLVPNLPTPGVGSIAPTDAMRTVRTSFTVVGTDLPDSGLSVTVPGDSRAQCDTPTSLSASGFTVACTLYQLGSQALEIRAGTTLLATASVNVTTNVADINWAAPSTGNVYGKDTVYFDETVTFKATGTNLLADARMGFAVQQCSTPDVETGIPAANQRTFTCVFSGTQMGQMAGVLKAASGGTAVYSLQVPLATAPVSLATGKLTDTGITADQCLSRIGSTLGSCTSAEAIAFYPAQDGMVGRDVTDQANTDGKLGFSYSSVGSYSIEECVKDNITGLTWEGKPTTGLRAATNTYTNHGDNSADDASTYVAAVNAIKLCGYRDWRLPTTIELQGLVDYGVIYPGPTIDGIWFPNTQQKPYWTMTNVRLPKIIHFEAGWIQIGSQDRSHHVRLVR